MERGVEMETLEQRFFREYEIEPDIKKGETYFTTGLRFAEVVADKDIYPVINAEKILEIENLLGNFSVKREIGPYDEYLYSYTSYNKTCTETAFSRKEALLYFLLKYPEYKPYVKTILQLK